MKFYRYEILTYSNSIGDDYGNFNFFSTTKLKCNEYNLHKETPKGYWIGYGLLNSLHGDSKWVSKTAKKRYAYPTKEQALINFIKRSEVREKILSTQLDNCKYGIKLAVKEQESLKLL